MEMHFIFLGTESERKLVQSWVSYLIFNNFVPNFNPILSFGNIFHHLLLSDYIESTLLYKLFGKTVIYLFADPMVKLCFLY